MLGAREEAAPKAAGKWPTASKRRQAIFTLSDDDTEEGEDVDTFRLVPRKRRRQLESMEQGGSSVLVGLHRRPLQRKGQAVEGSSTKAQRQC